MADALERILKDNDHRDVVSAIIEATKKVKKASAKVHMLDRAYEVIMRHPIDPGLESLAMDLCDVDHDSRCVAGRARAREIELRGKVLESKRARLGERDPEVGECLFDVAHTYYVMGKWDEAVPLLEKGRPLWICAGVALTERLEIMVSIILVHGRLDSLSIAMASDSQRPALMLLLLHLPSLPLVPTSYGDRVVETLFQLIPPLFLPPSFTRML